MRQAWAMALALLVAWAAVARADTVHLRDGRVLEGTVEETPDGYRVRMRLGTVEVDRRDVLRIERGPVEGDGARGRPTEGARPGADDEPSRRGRDAASDARSAVAQARTCRASAEELLGTLFALDRTFRTVGPPHGTRPVRQAANDLRVAARSFAGEVREMEAWARRFDWATRDPSPAEAQVARAAMGLMIPEVVATNERMRFVQHATGQANATVERLIATLEGQRALDREEEAWLRDLRTIRLQCNRVGRSLDASSAALNEVGTSLTRALESLRTAGPAPAPGPGPSPGPGPRASSVGTGFFVGPLEIITNAHVVGRATTVRVGTSAGEQAGTVVARDRELDLALVTVPAVGPGFLPLGPEAIQPGALAFAYGYGVLAGNTSTLLITRGTLSARQPERSLLVFDGKVNPGNSGGPLVDAEGRFLGVVVAKSRSSESEAIESMGLAVDGIAVARWLAARGVVIKVSRGPPPDGNLPPDAEVRRAVVRILAGD